MEGEFKVIPKTNKVAEIVPPILLSEKNSRQTTFEATQVDNDKDDVKNIKGKLIYKNKSKNIENFDLTKLSKRDIKSDEYFEMQLDTEETFQLAKGLKDIFYSLHGKKTPLEATEYVKKDEDLEKIKSILGSKQQLLEILKSIDLSNLNVAINCENLKRVKCEIEQNIDNNQEVKFWQPLFVNNPWVLSQLFAAPYFIMSDELYVGGKNLHNEKGKFVDYIYKNKATKNIVLIEIKNPTNELVGKNPYRGNDIFSITTELSGAVSQLLNYRDTLYKGYVQTQYNSSEKFDLLGFDCILLVGKIASLSDEQRKTFELFRRELRGIEIICFDELLSKIESMLTLLETNNI